MNNKNVLCGVMLLMLGMVIYSLNNGCEHPMCSDKLSAQESCQSSRILDDQLDLLNVVNYRQTDLQKLSFTTKRTNLNERNADVNVAFSQVFINFKRTHACTLIVKSRHLSDLNSLQLTIS